MSAAATATTTAATSATAAPIAPARPDDPRPDPAAMPDPFPPLPSPRDRRDRRGGARAPLALGLLGAALAGCGAAPERPLDPLEGDAAASPTVVPVTIDGPQDPTALEPSAARAPVERVVYFDYDRAELQPEYLDIVARHGRWLAQNPQGRVRLEGHTDERGSREYNIALGERRAKTVSRMLQLQGVSSAQLRTVSYGEELPVDEGHDPQAWSKNRRVNIIYEGAIQN